DAKPRIDRTILRHCRRKQRIRDRVDRFTRHARQSDHLCQIPRFAQGQGAPDLPRGSGCYGMNGHEDAAADAAILSRATGRPVRVQWTREDELGWDPKGPPQLIGISGAVSADGRILDWRTEMWIP